MFEECALFDIGIISVADWYVEKSRSGEDSSVIDTTGTTSIFQNRVDIAERIIAQSGIVVPILLITQETADDDFFRFQLV